MRSTFTYALTATALAALLTACGGSSDGTPAAAVAPVATTPVTISGDAVKGPVDGGTVTIKRADTGAVLATTTTKAGAYTAQVAYTGDVIIEVTGGSYTDEATGATTTLSTPLKSVITANGNAVTGHVTPLTTMAFTSSFPTNTAVTAASFKQAADKLATQFQLTGVDLTTTKPVVTGTANAYGNALKAVSQYLKDNQGTTLAAITNQTLTSAEWGAFSTKYSAAYKTATGQTVTYSIDGGAITSSVTGAGANGGTVTTTTTNTGTTVTGTGAGGGSGTCGVSTQGTVTMVGLTVPLNFDYCVTGLQGSCDAGNASLAQQIQAAAASSASLPAGVSMNINYSYSAACKAGAYPIVFK